MNMNKEYRKELRKLMAQEKDVFSALRKTVASCQKNIQRLQRIVMRETRLAHKAGQRFAKRRAVLEGRLS